MADRLRPLLAVAADAPGRTLVELLDAMQRGALAVYVRAASFAPPPRHGHPEHARWGVVFEYNDGLHGGAHFVDWTPEANDALRLSRWSGNLLELADGKELAGPCWLEATPDRLPELHRLIRSEVTARIAESSGDAACDLRVGAPEATRTPLHGSLGLAALLVDSAEVETYNPSAQSAEPALRRSDTGPKSHFLERLERKRERELREREVAALEALAAPPPPVDTPASQTMPPVARSKRKHLSAEDLAHLDAARELLKSDRDAWGTDDSPKAYQLAKATVGVERKHLWRDGRPLWRALEPEFPALRAKCFKPG